MKRLFIALFAVLVVGLSGCSSVKMNEASLKTAPSEKKAIVTFVRQHIFFGDAVGVDIWDGTTYVGSLGAGKMIQREVEPGKHVFIADAENFAYAAGELVAGKQYFIKANIYPGVLGARCAFGVEKADDKRVDEWLHGGMTPVAADEEGRKKVEQAKKSAIQQAITKLEAGTATAEPIQPENAR